MSPTRRDVLRTSAGAITAALTASAVSCQVGEPALAAIPTPLTIVSMDQVFAQATLSDGRRVAIGLTYFDDLASSSGIAIIAVGTPEAETIQMEIATMRTLDWQCRLAVLGSLIDAGYEVQR